MKSWNSKIVGVIACVCFASVALAVSPGKPFQDAATEVRGLKPLVVGGVGLVTMYGGLLWAFSDNPQSVSRGKRIVMGAIFLGLGIMLLQQVGGPIIDAINKFLDGGLLGIKE